MSGLVQNGAVATAASGVLQPTVTGVTAGNALICYYGTVGTPTLAAPTDSAGQTWTLAVKQTGAGGSGAAGAIAYLLNANSGTHTLSWATQPNASSGCIIEVNGITALGGTPVSNSGSGTSITSPSYTPGSASEFVVALVTTVGTNASDHVQVTTAGFQSIGTLSDFGSHSCTYVEQNGSSFNSGEGNAQVISSSAALTCAWSMLTQAALVSLVAGFSLPTPLPIVGQLVPTSGGSGNNSGGSNTIMWCPFTAYASGNATSLNAYVNSFVGTPLYLGLYKPVQPILVQSNNLYNGSSATTNSLTYTSRVTAGNTLFVVTNTFGGGTVSISDNLNGAWGTFDAQSGAISVTDLFRFTNTAGGACSITVTCTASVRMAIWIGEVSGLISTPLDLTAHNSATASTATSGATSAINTVPEFLIGVVSNNSNVTAVAVGGLTLDTNVSGYLAVAYGTASVRGPQSATFVLSLSTGYDCFVATYQPKVTELAGGNIATATGQNTVAISSTAIVVGQQYLLAWQSGNTSSLVLADDGTTAECFFGTNTAGSLPATLPAASGATNLGVPSLWASGTLSAGAQGTPLGGVRTQWHWR